MFRIKITYDTGDTFNHEYGKEAYIDDLVFDSPEKAEEAVDWIQEHYETRTMLGGYAYSYNKKDREKAIAARNKAPWYDDFDYAFNRPDKSDFAWKYQLKVKNNDGDLVNVEAFWCGHFESLVHAEVEYMDRNARKAHEEEQAAKAKYAAEYEAKKKKDEEKRAKAKRAKLAKKRERSGHDS